MAWLFVFKTAKKMTYMTLMIIHVLYEKFDLTYLSFGCLLVFSCQGEQMNF